MPAVRGPIPNRPASTRTLPAGSRAVGVIVLLALAVVLGWLAHTPGNKLLTRTIEQPPPSIYQHTSAGAVAAAEANLVQTSTSCLRGLERCQSADAYSLGPERGGLWSLAYRVRAYSPWRAVVEAWQLDITPTFPSSNPVQWELTDVPVVWTGTEWEQQGQVSQSASAPTPPDSADGPGWATFAQAISPFWRFPGAP